MIELTLQEWIYVLMVGVFSAMAVFFCASILYFVTVHRNGTADYAAKTVAIGLVTVPVAILLSLLPIIYVTAVAIRWLFQKAETLCWFIRKPKPIDCSGNDDQVKSTDVIIHLVHGTFEPMAPWTLPGSTMRKAIEDIGDNVKVSRFSWSGDNTPTARTKAAQALANQLKNSPSDHNYIVAHSHGGNIVREMSHSISFSHKIKGVCLLSPPFIFRRRITRTAGSFIFLSSLGFVFATQIPIAALLLPFGLYWPLGAVVTSTAALILEIWLSKRCRKSYANEKQERYGEEYAVAYEAVDLGDVQIFHAIGDEADSGLRFVSSLHEACFGVLSQLKAAAQQAKDRIHWPYVASYVFFIGAIGYVAFASTTPQVWMAVNLVGLVAIFISHLVQVTRRSKDEPQVLLAAALPIVTFSFWLAAAKAMAYGDWRLIFCPEVFISSSETPEGGHMVLKFAPQKDGTMMHSTHSHPKAVLNVAAWLKSKISHT